MTQPAQYISGRTVQEQMNELISYVDTRAAEVATDAIASDVAQVHQDMLDADADAQAAAASAAAAAGTLANAVKKTGEASQSIAGNISISGNLAIGGTAGFTGAVTVPTPANNTDAATKKYVDDANALDVHLAGAQAIVGVKTVPLETTGTFSGQIASSQKVKNELDNYTPMVRTTGNQVKTGTFTLKSQLILGDNNDPGANILLYGKSGNRRIIFQNIEEDVTKVPTATRNQNPIAWCDKNDQVLVSMSVFRNTDGSTSLVAYMRKSDGTYTWKTLATTTGE